MPVWTYSGNVYNSSPTGTTAFPLVSGAGNPIGYLERSHIHVSYSADSGQTWLELSTPSEYGFNTAGTEVVLVNGIASGVFVKVERQTPYLDEYVNFQSSSLLTADQLNTAELFSMYVAQELSDKLALASDSSVAEAPDDGKLYGRESKAWAEVPPPGIGEAPIDSKEYVRSNSAWKEAIDYILPIASASILGGVKVGANLIINGDGVLSATGGGGGGIVYKGFADFTSAAPLSPNTGDLYLNNTAGLGAWPGFIGTGVGIDDRAFFNGVNWDRLPGGGDSYWTQSGDDLYPGTATSDVKIGGTLPSAPNITLASSGAITAVADATISTLTVGLGGGSIATNTAVGLNALLANTTGTNGVAFGRNALASNTEGTNNTAAGANALFNNATGGSNSAFGREALSGNTTGGANSAFGVSTLFNNTEGSNNTAAGANALLRNITGGANSAFGRDALNTNATGAINTVVGYQAGYYIEGSNNTVLGAYKGTAADSTLNNTVIISAGTTEKLRINSTGSLLFGGTLPSAPNITLASSGAISCSNLEVTKTSNPTITLKVTGDNSTARASTFAYDFSDGGGAAIQATRKTNETASDVYLSFRTGGSTNAQDRMQINSTGDVLIGGTLPSAANITLNADGSLSANGFIQSKGGFIAKQDSGYYFTGQNTSNVTNFLVKDSGDVLIGGTLPSVPNITLNEDGTVEAGRLLVGATSAASGFGVIQNFTTAAFSSLDANYSNDSNPVIKTLGKSRGSLGTYTIVQENDLLGRIQFAGADGAGLIRAAQIQVEVDGTPGGNDMPGRLVLSTTADGASIPTERMRIDSNGNVGIGGTLPSAPNITLESSGTITAAGAIRNSERTLTAGAFDLATGNHWTCGAITAPAPTNAFAGMSGLIRITAGPVTWDAVFKFPGATAPSLASFPTIIPFYVESSSVILMGNAVEGIS